jgi:tRNA1Val (adenine37-N6)-methyltransferase
VTGDTPAEGLRIYQPRGGFRYGAEAFWLVGFALEGDKPASAADLGTGSGIMAMLLGNLGVPTDGYDVRPEWEPLWTKTLAESRSVPVRLFRQDVREVSGSYQLVVANPPYFPAGTGPRSPNPWKSAARTEADATLSDFLDTARRILAPGGRICLVLPVERAAGIADISRAIEVGQRRILLEIRPGSHGTPRRVRLAETGSRVAAWYAAAQGTE